MIDTLTHAYTVRQPFAHATAVGWKPIENKTERPPLALIGQLVGIHAGLQWARESDLPSWAKSYEMPAPTDSRLVYGALIGVARLVGVVRVAVGIKDGEVGKGIFMVMYGRSVCERLPPELQDRIRPWWRGPWGWLLEEAVLLPEPIPMRGQQGLWRLPTIADRVTNLDERGQWQLDERKLTAADLALEQWRKARETR